MNKILITLLLCFCVFLVNTASVGAVGSVAEGSAELISNTSFEIDIRVDVLKDYLSSKNSPLAPYAIDMVELADENGLDWRLIPAITGVESGYGIHIPKNSYNAYGWANGKYSFISWEDSISIVAATLKEKYIDRGANTINKIARIYAPPSTTWAYKVKRIMNDIEPMPMQYDLWE